MRKLARSVVLILVISACGGSTTESTTSEAPSVTTPPAASATTTSTQVVGTTSTLPEPSTTAPGSSGAKFSLTMVSLGVLGQVVIQNVGSEAGTLAGHWLCQRPSYYEFPDIVLQPGEFAAVSVGGDVFEPPEGAIVIEGIAAIGPFNPESGEVGLYSGGDFSNSSAILSYVEWGDSGHGRSGTAVAAQIWPEGGFVPTTVDSEAILATTIPPTDPAHWVGG